MKKLIVILMAALVCTGAFAQGKLLFQVNTDNLIYFTTDTTALLPADHAYAGIGAYVAGAGGTQPISSLAGSPTFVAALYGGTSAGSLVLETTTTINNYNLEGQLVPVNTTFATLNFGTAAFFQIQVYDSRSANTAAAWAAGEYGGESGVFQATPEQNVYGPVYQTQSPIFSTLPAGTATLSDYPGVFGLIALQTVVPEPGTFALAGLGLATLLVFRRRK